MTTDEFIKKVEDLGYTVDQTESFLFVNFNKPRIMDCCLLDLGVDQQYSLHVRTGNFFYGIECEQDREKLYDLAVEYDKTPVEKREKEKRYRVRWELSGVDKERAFLNKDGEGNIFFFDDSETAGFKTNFTDEEISEFPAWVKGMLDDGYLVKEEVKDDF